MSEIQSPIAGAETSTYTIPANGQINIYGVGEFVRCVESDANMELSFNGGSKTIFGAGIARFTRQGDQYSSFQLYNNSNAPINATVIWGSGNVQDSRLTVTGSLNIDIPANFIAQDDVVVAANGVTEVVEANSNRKAVYIHSFRDNEETLRISDENGKGIPLYAGDTAVLETKGAISLYNASGDAQSVAIGEMV